MRSMREENIKKFCAKYSNVYIFGAGRWSRYFINYFDASIYKECFEKILVSENMICENNPDEINGIPVCSIMNVMISDNDAIIVAIYDNEKIIEELLQKGYKNIFPFQLFIPVRDVHKNGYEFMRDHETSRYIDFFNKKKPFFKYIEIETINRCNGECSFCPVNSHAKQREYHKMSETLFKKIINELSDLKYDGLLALFSNNEAFLDERLVDFAKYTRKMLPKAYIYIISNGKLITLEKFKNIIPYLDKLQIDNYEPDKEKPKNICEIEKEVEIQNIQDKYVYFEIDKNAVRTSRGGNAPNLKIYYTTEILCPLPFVQIIVRPDGKISLCCNDALGENTLGDCSKDSLYDIWYGNKYEEYRKEIAQGRYGITTCRYCNFVDERELWFKRKLEQEYCEWEKWLFPPEYISCNKKKYIFGIDTYAKITYKHLIKKGYKIEAFCENYSEYWNCAIIDNIFCYSLHDIMKYEQPENIGIYLIDGERSSEVYHEFQEYGIKDIRIVFRNLHMNMYE